MHRFHYQQGIFLWLFLNKQNLRSILEEAGCPSSPSPSRFMLRIRFEEYFDLNIKLAVRLWGLIYVCYWLWKSGTLLLLGFIVNCFKLGHLNPQLVRLKSETFITVETSKIIKTSPFPTVWRWDIVDMQMTVHELSAGENTFVGWISCCILLVIVRLFFFCREVM